MVTKKKSTPARMATAVKQAARTVAGKADRYVVQPVGKALGLGGKKKASKRPAGKTSSAKARTSASAKKGAPKRTSK